VEDETKMIYVGIDPSTKTGYVELDENGFVIVAEEIKTKTKDDPHRMYEIVNLIKPYLKAEKVAAIEGFSFNSVGRRSDFQYGLGWAIRLMLHGRGVSYVDIAPTELKSYIGVTGWKGEKGNKTRLTGKEKKAAVMDAVWNRFGYENKSDNITDAFVLAHMARENYLKGAGKRETNEIV
jgi:crossover junction endodeoxyribonuclease RuvC